MTPIHPDLMKHSTPVARTVHEREALRIRRDARRDAFLAFVNKVLSHTGRHSVAPTRQPVNSPS